jgi:nucleotidyltransferase/DNA polymerase involved in DNA repair
MALGEARELVPTAATLPANPIGDAEILRRAIDLLDRFSDVIEEDGDAGAWFVLALPGGSPGDERRLGAAIVDGLAASLGLEARIGIGPGKFVARVAAGRATSGAVEVVAAREGAAYLAPLAITLLPLLPGAIERLKLLGITTIGELARLPADTLPRRFGREAILAGQVARGDDVTLLVPRHAPESLTMGRSFEPTIEDREMLLVVAQDLLGHLCRQLQTGQRACRSLELAIGLENGRVVECHANLRRPTNDPRHCLPLLPPLIEALVLDRPVAHVALRLGTIGREPTSQGELFGSDSFDRGRAERRERVVGAFGEVARRYRGRVRHIVPGDDPQSLLDDRRLLLLPDLTPGEAAVPGANGSAPLDRNLAEPAVRLRPIQLVARGQRIYLSEPHWQRDDIVALHARWEADDWWPDGVRRTYYRVRTRRGQILTLARDHARQCWLLVESFE